MAVLTTKYSVGDVVYRASTTTISKKHPCPDCKGARKWKVTSPAGGEYEFACPRCSARYNNDRDLTLDYSQFTPSVIKLTIGSVQYNSAPSSYDYGARYMCVETGIGSGSVYIETDLFPSEAEALVAAQAKANEQNATTEWVVTRYNKSLEISDYQLDSAILKKAKDSELRASSLLWNLSDLFSRIEESDDKDAILEAVDEYKTYDWARDKEKIIPVAEQGQDTRATGEA